MVDDADRAGIAQARQDASREGQLARRRGDSRNANPYEGMEVEDAWDDGWLYEDARSNRAASA